MRSLIQTLQDHDLGFLRIVDELWGFELPAEADAARLAEAVLESAGELALPQPAQRALEQLQRAGGRMSWEQLNRRFGPLREMGAGRRDRLKPWRDPQSALEMLWYRGLIGRAFADTELGPQEFGFVPSDLLPLLLPPESAPQTPLGKSASKPGKVLAAGSYAVDDATTVLAELRRHPGRMQSDQLRQFLLLPAAFELLVVLVAGLPASAERLKAFLTGSRGELLAWLQRAWLDSTTWNDLAQLGTLQVAGPTWPNDPVASRRATLLLLSELPLSKWWSLSTFVAAVHQRSPGFLRPPGGFESWYLQSTQDGRFLTGFANWEQVEGAYLRYLLSAPLHWLGAIELGADREVFRVMPAAAPLLGSGPQPEFDLRPGTVVVRSDGQIRVAQTADRSLRYQIARFTRWESADSGGYRYQLSAATLERAAAQGLTAGNAALILRQATGGQLPPGVARALERWESHGAEATLLRELVLQVDDPQVLERLTEHRTTRRWIQTRLAPNRAVVREADWEKLAAAALGLGLLIAEPGRRD